MEQHAYRNPALPVTERVADLLDQMTLEEKVAQMDMIRGVELATKVHEAHFCAVAEDSDFQWDQVEQSIGRRGMGFVHDIYSAPQVLNKLQRHFVEQTRLGIPCLFTGEALHGINYPGATVFPMPINLGATFHPELVHEVGHAIAAETRSLGIAEILAPNLDLAREPRWGRVEETFGEDTFLSSAMAYAIITGEQGADVSAPDAVVSEPKHYCVHGIPEGGTNCSSARVGVREIETSYLPVFAAGIQKAGAYNAMASYNNIDGEVVIASEHYLREVLKERFGLKGYVRADFGAINRLKTQHFMTTDNKDSIEMAVNAGLDVQGFDFANRYWQETLVQLVEEGRIPLTVIDDAVSRVLRVKFDLGLFEQPYTDEERYLHVIRSNQHKELSYQAAQESIVLLQNRGVLPLAKTGETIALIGPSSNHQRIGSYSSVPYGYTVRSIYEEMKKVAGPDTVIKQSDGCGITEHDVDLIPDSWYTDGVHLTFYGNDHFAGEPVGEDHVKRINFNWILAKPHRDLDFVGYSVRMNGKIKVNTHDFGDSDQFIGRLVFTSGDSVRVKIDGVTVINSVGSEKQRVPECEFTFVDGVEHDFEVEFVCDVNGNNLTFCLDSRANRLEEAIQLAESCDTVVLVCGDDKVTSGEGMDRSDLRLYGRQKELVERICALGKRTILVLENGKPVDLSYESEHCDAIVVAWFGGEFGAKAIVDVLFGDVSPSGKLPISFPRSVGHLPCYYSMLPGGSSDYLEGTRNALFSFGHGLSYTTFTYSNLCVEELDERYAYCVRFDVANSGAVHADEVTQLYIRDVQSSIVTPLKLLQGFKRISLAPGQTQTVEMLLDFDSFKLLNKKFQWVVEPGEFVIMTGSSSVDIRLEQNLIIR
ncbi:MAG: glycoside hydrolase family 3 C-terminal domain-containing protein [Gorillibacterium sp.]|nr:glycoside hydrolase family 3 C-terminal domain-containing protein [Gorillibacterium sp.]